MERERNNLHRTIRQIQEWVYGQTNLQHQVDECRLTYVPLDTVGYEFAFQVTTLPIRVAKLKNPFALLFEQVSLSITGTCTDLGTFTGPGEDVLLVEMTEDDMIQMALKQDQGGFSVVGCQFMLGLHDGGMKSFSRQFVFRGNMLNTIR